MAKNVTIDIMKGIGIMAVIAGHTNPDIITGKFILSFHMPLFMAISGYLFYFSINKHTLTIITEKLRGLILPLITWHTLY